MKLSAFFLFRSAFAVAFLATLALFAPPLANMALHTPVSAFAEKFPLKKKFVELNGGTHRLAGRRLCNAGAFFRICSPDRRQDVPFCLDMGS